MPSSEDPLRPFSDAEHNGEEECAPGRRRLAIRQVGVVEFCG